MVVCDNSAHCDNSLSTQLDVGGFGTALGCCSALEALISRPAQQVLHTVMGDKWWFRTCLLVSCGHRHEQLTEF